MIRNIGLLCALFLMFACSSEVKKEVIETEKEFAISDGYVGAETCAECHSSEHNDWRKSHHFNSMHLPDSSTVRANFMGGYSADSISYQFSTEGSEYFVAIRDQDLPWKKFRVAYTFGWTPLQQYLLEDEKGKFQTLRASWDVEGQKWFHQSAGDIVPHHDWLSWSKGGQNWNTMCSSCHSTNVRKNYHMEQDSFSTTYSEINVACESCHGPGKKHVSWSQSQKGEDPFGSLTIRNQKEQVNNCGTCHARRTMLADNGNPEEEFLQGYIPQVLSKAFYEPDGQIREEDFVYGSFVSSKMYHNDVKCSDCHSPHSGELKANGNALCLQCHEPSYASNRHHHHSDNSKGAQCINCHMDGKLYMGIDYRRDHSFRIPRPDQSVHNGTSNACNSCHSEKTAKWAATKVTQWYGATRGYHFSDDLIPGSDLNGMSSSHLLNLFKQDSIPNIAKATALNYMNYIGDSISASIILEQLNSPSPLVRQAAYNGLVYFPSDVKKNYAFKGLNDEIKAVRIMAFRSLIDVNPMEEELERRNLLFDVEAEYLAYLKGNSDFPTGQNLFGEYYLQKGDFSRAATCFERAIKMDSLLIGPYTNLAILYSQQQQYVRVRRIIDQGIHHFPSNAELHYYMGLNEGLLNNPNGQLFYLKLACELESSNPNYAYNYIVASYQSGKTEMAGSVLSNSLKSTNQHPRLLDLKRWYDAQ